MSLNERDDLDSDEPRGPEYDAGWKACAAHAMKVIVRLEARVAADQGAVSALGALVDAADAARAKSWNDVATVRAFLGALEAARAARGQ